MNRKKFRYSLNSKAFIIGAVVIVLLLNAILVSLDSKIPLEIDFTEDQIYALTEETKEIVNQIDEPTELLFLTDGTENDNRSMLMNILDKYPECNSNITLREINIDKNPAEIEAYRQEIESYYTVIIRQGDRYEVVSPNGFIAYGSDHGIDSNYSYVERIMTTKLAAFVDGMSLSTVHYTSGHGEYVSSGAKSALEMNGYVVEQLDTMTQDFPQDNKSVVIISAPQSDFSIDEINKLDQYLDRGGNVQVYVDPTIHEALPNLYEYLAADWGIVCESQIVIDADSMVYNNPPIMLSEMAEHAITEPVKETERHTGYGLAYALSQAADKPASVTIEPVMTTYDTAYAKESGETIMEQKTFQKVSGDVDGPFNLVLSATKEKGNTSSELVTSRLLVSGSALMFNDLVAEASFANDEVFLNAISWQGGGDASITVRIKKIPSGSLTISSSQFWTWFTILVVLVPIVVLACGIIVFMRRRYK